MFSVIRTGSFLPTEYTILSRNFFAEGFSTSAFRVPSLLPVILFLFELLLALTPLIHLER